MITKLPDKDLLLLIDYLSKYDENLSFDRYTNDMADSLKLFSRADAEIILKFAINLFTFKIYDYLDSKTISNDICALLQDSSVVDSDFTKEQCSKAELFIAKVLDSSNIGYEIKRVILETDQQNIYRRSTILTDFRPVFSFNHDDPIKRGIIIQTLKITYKTLEEHNTIYIALDSDDISQLKDNINRAEKKEEKLKELLKDKINFSNKGT